jgi:antirestriction protein
MKTLKQKFDSIDQSKISDTQKAFLDKVKDVTENFKSEDKEVNDKVETALDKMIETFKEKMPEALKGNSSGQPKKRNAMSVAKEIRKEGESFTEAKKRASKKIADDKADAKQTIKSELDKLNTFIKSRKKLANIKGTDLLIDSKRKALPKGKRISKNTGKVYYEYRDSKTDRLSPNYPKNAPYLAGGGGVDEREFSFKQAVNFVNESGKEKMSFYYNVFGGSVYYTLEPTFATPTGRLKGFPSKVTITKDGKITGKNLTYELGGAVVTDLAGHTGGSLGVGNKGMLDGFSNTSYSGLVGETGAMSSGELFMAGGSVGMANQQVIDDASQSYVNYYLGEGASAGMFKNGGAIKNQYAGRTPEDIWDSLSVEQRKHFLLDHYYINEEEFEQLQYKRLDAEDKEIIDYYANRTWKKLSGNVRKAFTSHVKEGQYAKGGGVRKVGNREYSYGRNWTNDHRHINQSENHEVKYTRKGKFLGIFNSGGALKNERKHVNHSEDYEIRYAKPRPSRKGYKGARKFMAGGVNNETPRIYVANLEAYNNGKLVGIWLDLGDYDDAKELMKEINNFIKNSGGDEYAIHDTENIPSSLYSEYMGENDFQEIYNMMELAEENHLPLEVVMMVINEYGESAVEEFMGKYDNEEDFAEQLVDDLGIENFIDFQSYLDISETDRRILAEEMASSYADDIRDEDEGRRLIEEGGLDLDEFENADDDRKEEMLDEARESVYDEYYDNWYQGLSDPYYFLVEEQGLYSPEDFAKADFVIVDYEKLGDALGYDYGFIYKDGDLYVFNVR